MLLSWEVNSCENRIDDSVGELGVRDALRVVGPNLTSGAKVAELGGRGLLGGMGKAPILELNTDFCRTLAEVSGDSSWMSAMSGLEPLFPGLMIVGLIAIRTQFWRLCPLMSALGTSFHRLWLARRHR